jgi:hypothetical protein
MDYTAIKYALYNPENHNHLGNKVEIKKGLCEHKRHTEHYGVRQCDIKATVTVGGHEFCKRHGKALATQYNWPIFTLEGEEIDVNEGWIELFFINDKGRDGIQVTTALAKVTDKSVRFRDYISRIGSSGSKFPAHYLGSKFFMSAQAAVESYRADVAMTIDILERRLRTARRKLEALDEQLSNDGHFEVDHVLIDYSEDDLD